MKKLLITFVFAGCILFSKAQDSSLHKKLNVQFQSFEQGGLLAGESKSAYHVETINGVTYNGFFGGVGIGIDNYVFRTIPLYIDIRKDVLNKPNTPFVFVDAGSQFQWVEDGQKHSFYQDVKYKSKFYFNAGAGYKIKFTHKTAFTFSAAYSIKKVNELFTPYIYCDPIACPEPLPGQLPEDVNKYSLKRLSLTAAITFW